MAAQVARTACERAGYSVEVAHSLGDGIGLLSTFLYDCILLDLTLPDVQDNGITAITELAKVTHLPIVVMTANKDESLIDECLNAGAQDYLIKTNGPDLLRIARAINNVVIRSRSWARLRPA